MNQMLMTGATKNSVDGFEKSTVILLFLIYSTLSTPIPQKIGIAELCIGVLLAFLVFRCLFQEIRINKKYGLALFACGWILIVPTLIGLGVEATLFSNYIRDVFPLLFLFLPLILRKKITNDPDGWCRALIISFVLSGLFLSLRYISKGGGKLFDEIFNDDSAPINQCSTVIFASVYCLSTSIVKSISLKMRIILALAGFICISTLMMAVMRAQIGVVMLGVIFILVLSKSIRIALAALLITVLLSLYIYNTDSNIGKSVMWTFEMVQKKTEVVGWANSRDAELATILQYAQNSLGNFLFGNGWGASMYVPTAGRVVRFTHNASLYFLWKTGVVGIFFIALYLYQIIGGWKNILRIPKLLFGAYGHVLVAVICALFVFGVIEMGYKMISYGFMICLLQAILMTSSKIEKTQYKQI